MTSEATDVITVIVVRKDATNRQTDRQAISVWTWSHSGLQAACAIWRL